MLRWHAASSSGMQHVMCVLLHLHFASSSGTQHRWEGWGGVGGFCVRLYLFQRKLEHKSLTESGRHWKTFCHTTTTARSMAHISTWQPGQPSAEKVCLSVLLAQFAEIAQPSTVLKTLGKVAKQKKAAGCVSFQDAQKMQFFSWMQNSTGGTA